MEIKLHDLMIRSISEDKSKLESLYTCSDVLKDLNNISEREFGEIFLSKFEDLKYEGSIMEELRDGEVLMPCTKDELKLAYIHNIHLLCGINYVLS